MSQQIGFRAEAYAKEYLIAQGLVWVLSNYHCRVGEIDLIMRDGEYLVFVEVRARKSRAYGGAAASITHSKRQKLLKAASYYVLSNPRFETYPMRFDVLSLDGMPPTITWIKNAFGGDF